MIPKDTTKIIYCIFIGYTYSNNAYWFHVHKSNIDDIHLNKIIELRNVTFLKDVFTFKWAQKIYSLKEDDWSKLKYSSSNRTWTIID